MARNPLWPTGGKPQPTGRVEPPRPKHIVPGPGRPPVPPAKPAK